MDQQKIIIIGASSGIGRELAVIYASRGHKVAITGRRNLLLEQTREQFPDQVICQCFDVMASENTWNLEAMIAALGGLDILVYNAGFGEPSKTLDWQLDRTTTYTNVVGFVEIVNYAFNYFIEKGKGQIVVTSSVAALLGNSWAPAYSASKAFMSNYAEGLNIKATRLKKDVVVTDLRPGFIKTKMQKGNKRFWVAPKEKAAMQIFTAIAQKKRVAYITKRWRWLALLLKIVPYAVYRRLV